MNNSLVQQEASKPVITYLFKNLLIEMKGFKYHITMKGFQSKQKENSGRVFDAIYFNSTANVVINLNKYGLDKSFREILYRLDNWINEDPAWIIEYIDGEFINIYIYNPLWRSTYIELRDKLKYPI